ncbi:MAG: S46 family peptidase [Bacteroidales bacterium]|nr:S46 family peptidase [Bacteroidales bacterium]
MLMNPDSTYYPDANFTMRLTYGNVKGYEPRDAVFTGITPLSKE